MTNYTKDPDAVLTYTFDWTAWLGATESIVSAVITAETGLTLDSDSISGAAVLATVSGGTAGESYALACRITTDSSPAQTDERTIMIAVSEQ